MNKIHSLKYKWFLILQIGFTIFSISIYYWVVNSFENLQELFDIWINFTWKNIALYFTANVGVKYIHNKNSDKPTPIIPVKDKIKSRKYNIFKYLQLFISIAIISQIVIYYQHFDHVIELISIWSEFTWMNIGVYFFGNLSTKYSNYQGQTTQEK